MAASTLRCPPCNQPRLLSMNLPPAARMISATSKGGRVILASTGATFHLIQWSERRLIERVPAAFK